MGLGKRLLLNGCLIYQAITLILITFVFMYFFSIGMDAFVTQFNDHIELLKLVAIPTTFAGGTAFVACWWAEDTKTHQERERLE